jgi:putative addiction module CopG family antidote
LNIALSPQSEELIRRQVEAGWYDDASDVVEEALSLLIDPQRFKAFKAAVDEGFEELERGEDVPFTPELFDDIRRTAREMAREGRTPDPNVCP